MAQRKIITDEDFDGGKGGFWIDAAGNLIRVHAYAEHYDTLRANQIEDYSEAYGHGWIRVSLYEGQDVNVNFYSDTVTTAALRALLALLRHSRAEAFMGRWQLELMDKAWPDSYMDFDKNIDGRSRDRMVRKLSSILLLVNAKAKAIRELEEAV